MTPISIITVTYNDCENLIATINSVISQNYTNFEYIIKDGESDDRTNDIVSSYNDGVDVFMSESDNGIYNAMNQAVKIAKGEFVLFMNAGDSFANRQSLANLASQCEEFDDIVYGRARDIRTGKVYHYAQSGMFWNSSVFDHQATLTRKALLQRRPFDENLRIAGDLDFFMHCRREGASFHGIPDVIAHKPFDFGVSSRYTDRIKERYEVSKKHWGDTHPVEEFFAADIKTYLLNTYGLSAEHLGEAAQSFDQFYEILLDCEKFSSA